MCPNFFGQSLENDDLKCEKILQEVSDNIQKNSASKFNFKLEIKSEDINEIQNGYALLENEKFYYKTEEREVICDGINVWTYLPEDNECYIDLLEDLDNTLNPSEIFTLWKEGFKFKYMNKTIVNNQTIHKIKMFPSQPDKSNFHTIIMKISFFDHAIQSLLCNTVTKQFLQVFPCYCSCMVNIQAIKCLDYTLVFQINVFINACS